MIVQSANPYAALSSAGISPRAGASTQASSAAVAASSAERVSISAAARALLAGGADGGSARAGTATYDTNQGAQALDIDAYFTPPAAGGLGGELPPLLLPTRNNIDALSRHIAAAMPQFLAENGIPAAPASVTYDNQGRIQLPADYPHAAEFEQALTKDPALAREMSTVHALASVTAEMDKSLAFQQEYAAASTRAEIDAVVAKYGELFSDRRQPATIALEFPATGGLRLTADGAPLATAA